MKKENLKARIRLVGKISNYELKRVMLKEIEGEVDHESKPLLLMAKQQILEDRFEALKNAYDRMKEENVGNTYRAAMRSIIDDLKEVQEDRLQVLEDRVVFEEGLPLISVLGNLSRAYDSRDKGKESETAYVNAAEAIHALEKDERQAGWRVLIDPLAGSAACMERLLAVKKELKGESLRDFYVGMISTEAHDDVVLAFKRAMEAKEALKGEESLDIYFLFLWETLAFLKQFDHPKHMAKDLCEAILQTADQLNHVPAVAEMHVFLANISMGQADYRQARKHLVSLEGIVDAYGYELLFEEHAEMIRSALADMRRDLPKTSKRSPLRLVEISPEEMDKFSMKNMVRN